MEWNTVCCIAGFSGMGIGPGKDGLPHTLLGDITMLHAVRSEGGLKDKPADLVLPLKLGPPLLLFLNSKVRLYMCTLDMGVVEGE